MIHFSYWKTDFFERILSSCNFISPQWKADRICVPERYHKYFPAADRYFTPFITNKKMSSRERNDILPEHNEGMTVIPQILTNQAEDFLSLTKELKEYGYDTVNLNLGCPSKTVGDEKAEVRDFWTDRMNWTNSWMRFSVNVI